MNLNWTIAKIEEIAEINPRLGKADIPDDLLVSFVPMPAVGAGNGSINVSNVRPYAEVKKGFTAFQEGDVLFAKITPCMENGKMAIVPRVENGYAFGSTEFHVLRPKPGIDARYLYYYVSSRRFRGEAEHQMSGAVGQKRVPTQYLRECTIPVAPSNEQTRIVAEIEKQFSRLDEAVANLKRVKANLKRYKASVLKAAVEGTIVDQDHSTWEVTSLGAVATTIRNGFSGKPDAEAGTRIFRISAVRPLRLDLDEVRYLSGEIVDYSPSVVSAGDVLFTRYNGNPELVGVCAVVPENCPETVHPDKLIRVVTPREILIPEMLALLASAGEGRSFIKSKTRTTAGQAGISGGDLKALPIKIPPLKIQHQIVAEVERRLSIVAGAEAQVDANLRRADRLRQSILKQAFSGQLVPQNPNDEPSSVLLERIRANVSVGADRVRPDRVTHKAGASVAPLRKPRPQTEPAPAVSDNFACLDDVPAAILARMQSGREYARAELADLLGLTTDQWNTAIRELKRVGKVRQVGEKRGARYVLGR